MFAGSAAYRNWALISPAELRRQRPGKGSDENGPGAAKAGGTVRYEAVRHLVDLGLKAKGK
jgi:hypothetical protein